MTFLLLGLYGGGAYYVIPEEGLRNNLLLHSGPIFSTGCGFGYFLMYFGFSSSSALLVLISVEKFFALYFPFKTKAMFTVSMARKVSLVTAIIFVGFNSQFFFITKKFADEFGEYCYYSVSWNYLSILFGTVVAILYSYAPFTFMILSNFAIICKFVTVKRRNGRSNTESTSQALSKSTTTGIVLLLTVSFAFIILTAPILVANVVWPNSTIPILIFKSLLALQYLNHGINGILYCIVGSRFRNELKSLFGCGKETRSTSYTLSTAVDRSASPKKSASPASTT